jgi:hypothetical protein
MDKKAATPAKENPAIRVQMSQEEIRRLIEDVCGSTADGPSMCDELLEDRRRERERELAEEGW